jgi:hypothetical protein
MLSRVRVNVKSSCRYHPEIYDEFSAINFSILKAIFQLLDFVTSQLPLINQILLFRSLSLLTSIYAFVS